MSKQIKVSILCLAFNHVKYIRKCLEGFVSQKTNFSFEVLIHDDASSDGTTDIIKEFEQKYSDVIKPIYQKENQYSQGVKITKKYQLPRVQGEYLAWCEGDDCWTDCDKLQKQVDFLDKNQDYSICVHKVLFNNLKTKVQYKDIKNIYTMSEQEVKANAKIPLSVCEHEVDIYWKVVIEV